MVNAAENSHTQKNKPFNSKFEHFGFGFHLGHDEALSVLLIQILAREKDEVNTRLESDFIGLTL